jgi:hypothetical protein
MSLILELASEAIMRIYKIFTKIKANKTVKVRATNWQDALHNADKELREQFPEGVFIEEMKSDLDSKGTAADLLSNLLDAERQHVRKASEEYQHLKSHILELIEIGLKKTEG